MLSDDGDHSVTGIVLLVGGLQMRERYDTVTVWGERKKGKKKHHFKRMCQKKFINLICILF